MKKQLEKELEDVLYKLDLLDTLVMVSSEEESSYELEHAYLRGKRDMLLHLVLIQP